MFDLQFKKKVKTKFFGYIPTYVYPNHHYIIPTISYHTYRVPIQMLNKKQCFIIQQELKKRGVKQLKFKSPQ